MILTLQVSALKYSIIIPHYNSAKLLLRLLRSIPDRKDVQVLVIDDLSDPGCFNSIVIDASNVSVYRMEKKGFAGGARNFGLSMALGDYVIFADSDDIFSESAFDVFDDAVESKCDLILFKTSSFVEGTDRVGSRDDYRNKRLLSRPRVAALGAVGPVAKLVSRQLIIEHGLYFSEVIAANDVAFSVKLACVAARINVIQKVVYLISQGSHTLSADVTLEKALSRLQEQRKRVSLVRKYRPVSLFKYCLSHSLFVGFMRHSARLRSDVYDEEFRKYQGDLGWLVVGVLRVEYFIYRNIVTRFFAEKTGPQNGRHNPSKVAEDHSNARRMFVIPDCNYRTCRVGSSSQMPMIVDLEISVADELPFEDGIDRLKKTSEWNVDKLNCPMLAKKSFDLSLAMDKSIFFSELDEFLAVPHIHIFNRFIDDRSNVSPLRPVQVVGCAYQNEYFFNLTLRVALAAVPPWENCLKRKLIVRNNLFLYKAKLPGAVAFVISVNCLRETFAMFSGVMCRVSQGGYTLSSNLGVVAQLSRLKEQRKRIEIVKRYKPVNSFFYCLEFSRLKYFIAVGKKIDSSEFDQELKLYKKDLGFIVCSLRKITGVILFFTRYLNRFSRR